MNMMQRPTEGGSCGDSGHTDSRTKGGAIVDRKSRARRRFKVSGTTFEVIDNSQYNGVDLR